MNASVAPTTTWRWIINLLLVTAMVLLITGFFAPMMTLKKFVFVSHTFSLLGGIRSLWESSEQALAIAITLFSVVLPIVKLMLNALVINVPVDTRFDRGFGWLKALGRWSMLDVFVVAVLFATVKLGALADTQLHYGVFAFAAAVLVTMLAAEITARVRYKTGPV